MKKLMLIAACAFSVMVFAGNDLNHPDKYCAHMKDGRLVVMHEGKALTSDVTLSNGTVVKMDGTVIKKDGTRTMLKEWECVDLDGKVMEEKTKKEKK